MQSRPVLIGQFLYVPILAPRSSLNDCLLAAKLKPDYVKAIVRATQCCLKLKRFDDGLQWCDYGLRLKINDPAVLVKLRTELVQGKVCQPWSPYVQFFIPEVNSILFDAENGRAESKKRGSGRKKRAA